MDRQVFVGPHLFALFAAYLGPEVVVQELAKRALLDEALAAVLVLEHRASGALVLRDDRQPVENFSVGRREVAEADVLAQVDEDVEVQHLAAVPVVRKPGLLARVVRLVQQLGKDLENKIFFRRQILQS